MSGGDPNLVQPTYLSYDRGTILIRGDVKVPYSTWDDRVRAFRAQGLYYRDIVDFLNKSELSATNDGVQDLPPYPDLMKCRSVTMRGYQKRALEVGLGLIISALGWIRAHRR